MPLSRCWQKGAAAVLTCILLISFAGCQAGGDAQIPVDCLSTACEKLLSRGFGINEGITEVSLDTNGLILSREDKDQLLKTVGSLYGATAAFATEEELIEAGKIDKSGFYSDGLLIRFRSPSVSADQLAFRAEKRRSEKAYVIMEFTFISDHEDNDKAGSDIWSLDSSSVLEVG